MLGARSHSAGEAEGISLGRAIGLPDAITAALVATWGAREAQAHFQRAAVRLGVEAAAASCSRCSHPAAPGRRLCEACLAMLRRSVRAYARRHRQAGLCEFCPRPAVPGRTRCARCLARQRAQWHATQGRRAAEVAQG